MAHLTIMVDEDTLVRARSKALEEGTSVDSLLRSYLEAYSNSQEGREQTVKEQELSNKASGRNGGRLAALRALAGTAHSKFTDISTDKYAHVAAAGLDSED